MGDRSNDTAPGFVFISVAQARLHLSVSVVGDGGILCSSNTEMATRAVSVYHFR